MKSIYIVFTIVISFLVACSNHNKIENIEINNISLLDSVFAIHKNSDSDYIPPIFVNNIPNSIKELTISERKVTFTKILLANIIENNNNIISERDSIIDITKRLSNNRVVTSEERIWLEKIYKIYRCKPYQVKCLLKKVDIIPPSMAIAQTIVESGWGTSRFAIEGNSLFGEHFSNGAKGKYVSASGSSIKLRAFNSIQEAVKSYSININRHRAYREFRDTRFKMRTNSEKLNSIVLIETLGSYSELGNEYISYIKNIIIKNSLQNYDNTKLYNSGKIYQINIKE